jgi:aldose sugar dehydrogenase
MKINIVFGLIIVSMIMAAFVGNSSSREPLAPAIPENDDKGITVATILSGLNVPWEIAWGPDNCIWYTEQDGFVSKFNPATREKKLLLKINDLYRYNLGLLSMAIHPDFSNQPYVFLNYTYIQPDSVIRSKLVRYTFSNDSLIGPLILLDIPANRGHNGSRIAISPDGKLFLATGDTDMNNDSYNGGNAQNANTPGGKILRLNIDGTIPDDNPLPGNPLWAMGFRVPQGLVFGMNGTLYSCEHGNDQDDEINIIAKNGNYGYPYVLGKCDEPNETEYCSAHNITPPIKAWTPTIAPSGIDYYRSAAIPEWTNTILVATLKTQSLRVLKLNAAGTAVIDEKIFFEKKFGRLRDICISPSGDVYISTSNRDWNPASGFPVKGDDRIIKLSKSAKATDVAITSTTDVANPKTSSRGETIYENYCGSCHKQTGEGVKGIFPALKGSKLVSGNKENLIRKVMFGAKVQGETNEKFDQKMSSFQFLKDEELANVLTYVRKKFGGAGAVTIQDIKRSRNK